MTLPNELLELDWTTFVNHKIKLGAIGLSFATLIVAAICCEQVTLAQEQEAPAKPKIPTGSAADQAEFYRPDKVQSVYLQVTPEDQRRMIEALPERIYVPASFRWRDIFIEKVAIRFKGNSSSSPRQRHKRSYLIKFDKYDKKARFLGLERASMDNGVQFGSLFSEPIITEIIRDLGIVTHRSNFAKLYINDEYRGVYGNVERIDGTFVDSHLPDPKGLLFKVDLGGPGCSLQFLGDDPRAYEKAFERKSKSAKENSTRLVAFIKMVNESRGEDVAKNLEAQFELDEFLQITAVMLFSGAFDQLTGWNHHNYYLYHDGNEDRWRYLPWDLDVGFCEIAFGKIHVLADWNAAWPIPGEGHNPLLEQIVGNPVLLARYRQTASEILDKYFEPERLCKLIDAKYELIKEDLENDPFPHGRATNPQDRSYADIVASQKEFVRKRYALARQQLDNPGPRPKVVRRQREEQPKPGPASKDAPSKLRVVANSASSIGLEWQDNATREFGYIVQRAAGTEGGEFRNHIGQPGDNITKATDKNVEPGKSYRYRVYAFRAGPNGPRGSGVSNVATVRVKEKE